MKIKILTITAIVMMAGSFYSCENNGENIFAEPIEIPVTEYSLSETNCWWTNTEPNKVIVINSNKELEKHVACLDDFEYHDVDFSRQTLLLTSGTSYNGVIEISSTFLQIGSEKYTWKIIVRLNIAMIVQGWQTAILVPKLTNKAIIVTEVQQTHF
jgi:fumarylacetoacetate (FAA) hydrolase family protein